MDVPQEVGAKILPFRKKDKLRVMTDEKEEMVTTSFTIPKRLNDMLRQDGIRCHRTTVTDRLFFYNHKPSHIKN